MIVITRLNLVCIMYSFAAFENDTPWVTWWRPVWKIHISPWLCLTDGLSEFAFWSLTNRYVLQCSLALNYLCNFMTIPCCLVFFFHLMHSHDESRISQVSHRTIVPQSSSVKYFTDSLTPLYCTQYFIHTCDKIWMNLNKMLFLGKKYVYMSLSCWFSMLSPSCFVNWWLSCLWHPEFSTFYTLSSYAC